MAEQGCFRKPISDIIEGSGEKSKERPTALELFEFASECCGLSPSQDSEGAFELLSAR